MAGCTTFCFVGERAVGKMVDRALRQAGLSRAESPEDAEAVFTYCLSQTALEDAYFDTAGLVQACAPGTLLVDLSPSTPGFARELAAIATVNDLAAVEAPLLVADPTEYDPFANPRLIACFVAGEEDDVARAGALLERFAGTVTVTGAAGTAQLARAAYTLQATAQVAAAIEADALYRVFRGAATSFSPVEGRAGAATPLADFVLEAVEEGRFEGTYTVEMFMAELSAALMAADDMDLILPQAESVMHLLELLAVIGGAQKAPAALSLLYREEGECAEYGLDWSRAEQAYGHGGSDDGDDDDCGDDPFGDDFGYSGYSAN